MDGYHFRLAGANLIALGSGALYWPEKELLCVSDLHLGKSSRLSRQGGPLLPPYEVQDTLYRLETEIILSAAKTIVCLGDSFDDFEAESSLLDDEVLWLSRLQAGRCWVWIEGNHDPGPTNVGGTHMENFNFPPLTFRHIPTVGQRQEVAGHYHPKAQINLSGRNYSKPCFLLDEDRVVLPAFGTFTGGLKTQAVELLQLMKPNALAVLTGKQSRAIPMPR